MNTTDVGVIATSHSVATVDGRAARGEVSLFDDCGSARTVLERPASLSLARYPFESTDEEQASC